MRRSSARETLTWVALAATLVSSGVSAQDVTLSSDDSVAIELEEAAPVIPDVEPGQAPQGSVGGMGDINLFTKRIVIDRRQRIASIGVYNKTANRGDYEISISDMLMTPEGRVIPIDNLPEGIVADRLLPASGMLRWSPRRVMLLGNEAQTVRIMARPPADLPPGEYRSHFMIVSVPEDSGGLTIEQALEGGASENDSVGVVIRPRFGISIPVIVRIGETSLAVGLEVKGLVETDAGQALALTLNRSGTRSAFGDLVVSARGVSEPVAVSRGVGVYPEIDSRDVVIPINTELPAGTIRPGSILNVRFVDDDVNPGELLASQDYVVP